MKVSLNDCLVRSIRRSDECIVRNIQAFPEMLKLRGELVTMRLRIDSRLYRGLLHLLSVLVEAGQEKDIMSTEPPIARKHIGGDGRIGVSDMRDIVHVIDRGSDVIRLLIAHGAGLNSPTIGWSL